VIGRFRLTARSRITWLVSAVVVAAGVALLVASYALVRANLYGIRPTPPRGVNVRTLVPPGSTTPGEIAHRTLSALVWQYSLVGVVLIIASAVVAWLIAGRLLRPIRTITATARRITSEDLHERLALPGPHDELGELGDTFDSMLARLEAAFQDEQLFAANAAHQLRTPLAVLGAELELLSTDPELDSAEVRESASRMRRTVVHAQQLLEKLLTLTRGSVAPEERVPVRLDQLVGERIRHIARQADEMALTFKDDLAPVTLLGDRALLAELVDNLLDNAIGYNVEGGHVEVKTRAPSSTVVLDVTNSGPRIVADVANLLEPFRRADQQRIGSGYGLGLSVVRAIARAHDGLVDLDALAAGGMHVRVTFPALSP